MHFGIFKGPLKGNLFSEFKKEDRTGTNRRNTCLSVPALEISHCPVWEDHAVCTPRSRADSRQVCKAQVARTGTRWSPRANGGGGARGRGARPRPLATASFRRFTPAWNRRYGGHSCPPHPRLWNQLWKVGWANSIRFERLRTLHGIFFHSPLPSTPLEKSNKCSQVTKAPGLWCIVDQITLGFTQSLNQIPPAPPHLVHEVNWT